MGAQLPACDVVAGSGLVQRGDRGSVRLQIAQRVVDVVEGGAREPAGAGHGLLGQYPVVRSRRVDVEVLPHRGPEPFQVGDGPAVQGLVVGGVLDPFDALVPGRPSCEVRDAAVGGRLRIGVKNGSGYGVGCGLVMVCCSSSGDGPDIGGMAGHVQQGRPGGSVREVAGAARTVSITTRSGRSRTASDRPRASQAARMPSSPRSSTWIVGAPSAVAMAVICAVGGTPVRTAKESPRTSSRRTRLPSCRTQGCGQKVPASTRPVILERRRTSGPAVRAGLRSRLTAAVTPGMRQAAPTAARRNAAPRSCPPVMAQPTATAIRITWRACGLRSRS